MDPIGPREGSQKSPKPPNLGAQIWAPGDLRNEAFGLGFFMFFIGAKNKKSNFFFEMISNHSKMVPNTPKLYLNVILVCFAVIGANIGDFDHFGDFWSKKLICPLLKRLVSLCLPPRIVSFGL